MLDAMNDQWDALVAASLDKGRKLRQAASQVAHNKTLEDAKSKLDELTTEMNQTDVGNDLRSCREKLKKQQMNNVASLDQKDQRFGDGWRGDGSRRAFRARPTVQEATLRI